MSLKQVPFRLPEDVKVEFHKKLLNDGLKAQEFCERIVLAYLSLDNEDFINDREAVKTAIKTIISKDNA